MAKSNKFGTFGGVFTPSILTILGVIMYMRLPMIIGEAGLFGAIGIIIIAHVISVTTGLSVSSIATDKKVQAGGTYYIISRSLGLPIGGTLGLALFVGLSFSVSLYLIGFAESFLNFWGFEVTKDAIRMAGSAILLAVTIITFISTSLALKTQYFIMAAIFLSLLSIFFGKHEFAPAVPLLSHVSSTVPLMVLFGIYFPAVTGFEAGVSMSGDLKDPKISIPLGTISAIGVGLIVYIGLTFFLAYTVDATVLAKDPKVLLKIARIPELVIAGIWGATLSSALGSILAAPRILQATAKDRITHKFFSKGTGSTNEPRNALLLTFVIAEGGILIGELDVIARIVSIFFITTYGFLNLSCAFERMTSADFRPAFKTPAWISLLGSAACILVMIQLDFIAMLGATFILGAIYLYLKRKELALQSGDAWSSLWASLVKSGLRKLRTHTLQTRNWRPNIVMFSGEENSRPYMFDLGKDISGRLGILTGFELEESNEELLLRKKDVRKIDVESSGFFMNHHTCRDIYSGMDEIMRVYGFSGIEPNTILMGWSTKEKNRNAFTQFIRKLEKNNFNSIFLNYKPERKFGNKKTIDIWWSGWGQNLTFAINLIRHLTSSTEWEDSEIRLFIITQDNTLSERIYKSTGNILEQYRTNMEIRVINNSIDKLTKNEIIQRESAHTDLTIVGIPDRKYQHIDKTYDEVSELIANMGTTLLINASGTFEEYTVISEDKTAYKNILTAEKKISLPALKTSVYQLINDEIQKIDKNEQEVLKLFYEKSMIPFLRENAEIVKELESTCKSTVSALQKLSLIKESQKKKKQLFIIRNDFNFKAKARIERLLNEKYITQKELLSSGIEWYFGKLEEDNSQLPKKLTLHYNKNDFTIKKPDPLGLKWYKFRKKVRHPFSKDTIKGKIKYRAFAKFYLMDSGYQSFRILLKEFNQSSLLFLSKIKELLFFMENQMDVFSKNLSIGKIGTESLNEITGLLAEKIKVLNQDITDDSNYYYNRLLTEYRGNMQLFISDLEKINSSKLLSKKRKKTKFYRLLRNWNIHFPDEWLENILHNTNKLLLDLTISSLKNQLNDETSEFIQQLRQQINSGILNKILQFKKEIHKINADSVNLNKNTPDIKMDSNFLELERELQKLTTAIDDLTEKLPESIEVSEISLDNMENIQEETMSIIEIPVRRIAKHFIDSMFIGQLEEYLTDFNDKIRNNVHQIKDHVSYMYFELENLNPDSENLDSDIKIIIEETEKELIPVENTTLELYNKTETEISRFLEIALEPLSHARIIDSNREIPHYIMEYKGKKTYGKVEKWAATIKESVRRKIVRLLYSRSEGVLFARKITEGENQQSISGQILDIVTNVSPDPAVYNAVPVYYKNLFSGRSSISEDFWIERKTEQEQFEKAFKNYRNGYLGGIMVLGERNSGKTTFCRHIAKKYFKNERVYHVFPPLNGSIKPDDLYETINVVTNLGGNIDEIFERLPDNSVMVFHDLELWWEMSAKGYEVIQLIMKLIKNYSSKCLFIVNMNQYAYKKLNKIYSIEDNFIGVLFCMPFDSEELKDLIMKRHFSGGLKFVLGKKREEQISEIRMADLFNKYFNYSEGNPGLTLYTWIAQIKKFTLDRLFIVPPNALNMHIFENLDDDWQVILIQLIYHKRMDINKLMNVLQIDESEIKKNINSLMMAGLVKEKSNGLFVINRYIDRFLTASFHEHELI